MLRVLRHIVASRLFNLYLLIAIIQPYMTGFGLFAQAGVTMAEPAADEPAGPQGQAELPLLQGASLAAPAALPQAPQALQASAPEPLLAADGSPIQQSDVIGPLEGAPGEQPQTLAAEEPTPGSAGTITVNTTSMVVDGDVRSVAQLIQTPDNQNDNNPQDDQEISLPEALLAVKNTGPGYAIKFELPGQNPTITVAPGTPQMRLEASHTVIDGDMNLDGRPDVMIDGPATIWRLDVRSSNNIIRGLIMQGLGFQGEGAHSNLVAGNYFGTDHNGELGIGKEHHGVEIRADAHHNIVENNLIAGNAGTDGVMNSSGVAIWAGAHDNIVRGNRIGVDIYGAALPNEIGVRIGNTPSTTGGNDYGPVAGNQVGGERAAAACEGPCNVVAGALTSGVLVHGEKAQNTVIAGNYIGLNLQGAAVPNVFSGVVIQAGAQNTLVGGEHTAAACDRACNVIAGNTGTGVLIGDAATSANAVKGNLIGLGPDNRAPAANQKLGVSIQDGAHDNTIGGSNNSLVCAGACNVIAGNNEMGVALFNAHNNAVAGNYIGVSLDGTQLWSNGMSGVQISDGSTGNTVGGLRAGEACQGPCNVVAGNTEAGVVIHGAGTATNTVVGNYVGLRLNAGTPIAAENKFSGVVIQSGASGNTVGGDRAGKACDGPCNVISGNRHAGVGLLDPNTATNTVKGNYIGTNPAGANSMPNGRGGVVLQDGPTGTTIGGLRGSSDCAGPCNVIAGNGGPGVAISGEASQNNRVLGNYVGSNANGTTTANQGAGVLLQNNARRNQVGDAWTPSAGVASCQGPCNLISGNAGPGVLVGQVGQAQIRRNTIRGNLIHTNNAELAIDLANDGPSHNDKDDADSGPNDMLNAPAQVLLIYNAATNKTTVTGRVRSPNPASLTIDLYATDAFGPSGSGEAKSYLGSVTPSASGDFTFVMTDVPPFNLVSASATDADGSTSELSGHDIWATGLEVVQSIQDAGNSVALDATERTIARLHVRTNVDTQLQSARIIAERNGAVVGEQAAANQGAPVDAITHPSRNDRSHSFIFELPADWTTAGDLTLRAEFNLNAPTRDAPTDLDLLNNTLSTQVTFAQPGTLRVILFPISYPLNATTTLSPTRAEIDEIKMTVERMFPGKVYFYEKPTLLNEKLGELSVLVGAPLDRYRRVNSYLRELRDSYNGTVPFYEYWYAIVPKAPNDPRSTSGALLLAGRAEAIGAPIGSGEPDPSTAAHELGHMLGRKHVACKNEAGTDPDYPYAGGRIGGPANDKDRYVGFYLDDLSSLPLRYEVKPSTYGDLMSYCDPVWISRYTYEQIGLKLTPPGGWFAAEQAAAPQAPVQGDFLSVQATIDTVVQQGTLVRLARTSQVAELPARIDGPYRIRLFGQNGSQLADYPFTPSADVEVENRADVYQIVPFVAGTRRVAIYSNAAAKEIASAAVSANAPTVTVTQPVGGAALPASGTITLAWQGADADGNNLTYTVLYSHDAGASWQTVATAVASTSMAVDVARLRGTSGASGRFRVVAHDGVLTGGGVSAAFSVPAKPPVVQIASPAAGSTFRAGQAVALQAWAEDPEDGLLDDGRIRWSSNRDGDLGLGQLRSARLSAGTHQLTVTATDASGQTATATTSVVIEADLQATALRLEQEVVERTNAERAAHNLPPLKLQPNLTAAAMWMARDMLEHNYMSHTDHHGRAADTRIRQFGYAPSEGTAENLAKNQATPADVVAGWMNSPDHRANILNPLIREIGVGYAADPNNTTRRAWVQNFGFRTEVYPLVINREAASTTSAAVDLYIYGGGWAQSMRLSNDGTSWTAWEAYAPTRAWTLAGGAGARTVYVELRNGGATLRSSDTIELAADQPSPTPTNTPEPTVTPTPTQPPAQSGYAWAWGSNADGQLGDGNAGTTYTRASAGRVAGLTDLRAIAAGLNFGVAVKQDGTVWAWGDNSQGQLGDGGTADRATPAQVPGIGDVIAVEAGGGHALALKQDGTVWAWGDNARGQLGDGGTADRKAPAQVAGLSDVVAIAAGDNHSVAVKRDGTVWAWGANDLHQVGVDPRTDRRQPVQVTLPPIRALAAGGSHNLAITQDNKLYSWGSNLSGQLANGGAVGASTLPKPVLSVPVASGVAAAGSHSLALKQDGTVWAWGYNGQGQNAVPAQVAGLTGVSSIAAGQSASYALKSDGTAWAWGYNGQGQLGDGTMITRNTPVLVEQLSDVLAIEADGVHAYAISTQAALPAPPPPDQLPAPGTPPAPVVATNGPWQVKDIVAGANSGAHADPGPGLAVGGTTFFAASTERGGRELWRTDGTAAGTTLVRDIHPNGSSNPQQLTGSGGALFFTANDGSNSAELWRTDGTAAGTVMLKDIFLGEPGGVYDQDDGPRELTDVNGTLFFVANDGWLFEPSWTAGQNWELWKTDGTAAGTVLVAEIARYFRDDVGSNPRELTNVNGTLFFTAEDMNLPDGTHTQHWTHGRELWKSDGTAAGTVLVKDIISGEGGSVPVELTNVNGTLFFVAEGGEGGRELWRTDGTAAGTVQVKDIVAGAGSSNPQALTNVNGTLFFTAQNAAGGRELWKSDGSEAGTVRVKDIVAGAGSSSINHLTASNGRLFFSAADGSGSELWKSDGSEAGTVRVKDIAPGALGGSPECLTDVNGTLFFVAIQSSSQPRELWKSDGSEAGTARVKAVTPAWVTQNASECLTNGNGTLFFAAGDGAGRELWKSNGTDAGTARVKDINAPGNSAVGAATDMATVNNTLVFRANDGASGDELWSSNGTEAGTTRLKDIAAGSASANPSNLFVAGQWAFFNATDGANGYELWRTDGTAGGTALVKNISPKESHSRPEGFTKAGSVIYFVATSTDSGRELWRTDGTASGTVLVKDIAPGIDHSEPRGLTDLNGTLFFAAKTTASGYELWKSDGTAAGTVQVKDIAAGASGSEPKGLVNLNGTLFFVAKNYELWKSDGTASGTVLVKNLSDQFNIAAPEQLTVVNGRLFFVMNKRDLWTSDGTEAGTLVLTGFSDRQGGTIGQLTAAGNLLLFAANNNGAWDASGWELWRSNGTVDGTRPLKDIAAGAPGSMPQSLAYLGANSLSVFAANDGASGMEVWRTNNTASGTNRVADLAAGPTSSNPRGFTVVGPLVFFWADNGPGGDELWALPLSLLGTAPPPPTNTPTPTNTAVPPTPTNTPTNTAVPPTPTNTPTSTAVPGDTTRPKVIAQSPAPAATNVLVGSNINATFSEPVKGVSSTSFKLKQGTTSIAAVVTYDAAKRKAILKPNANLGRGKTYTVTLTSAITDNAGNKLSTVTWTFTTQP